MAHKRECEIHAEEPCGQSCDASCDAPEHHKPAVTQIKDGHAFVSGRWVCAECLKSIHESRAHDAYVSRMGF